ncbi:MAG TPA: 2-succinylbenzoate--CoA ligase [Candidatus Hydrogenedentes bacterium]|nr:2-succinylbenzoate--CoA ligase [Candidatus Hydrogenedentota bacterium]
MVADIFTAIGRHARRRPEALAIHAPDETITYARYESAIGAIADNVRAWDMRPGSCTGIAAYTSLDYVMLLMGLMRAGAVACPMNPRWPMRGILDALRPMNAEHLFLPARIEGLGIRTFALAETRSLAASASSGKARKSVSSHGEKASQVNPCLCIFTSGSSGKPKAAMHGLANLTHSAETANANMPLEPGDRWLLSLPLFHVAGMGVLFRCAVAGAAVSVPATAESIEDGIMRCGATHVSLVAAQLHRLLQTDRGVEALSGLKAILLGGSAIPETLIRRAVALSLPIHTSYGMTETASQITATRPGDPLQKLMTSGRPLAPDTVRVARDGEIQVRGGSLFLGYRADEGLHLPLTDDGWFATGDLGAFDADGYLRVTGRKDRMFVAGGENIHPETIEHALCAIDGVGAAAVVPIADEEFGRLPVAFVLMEPRLDEKRLREELGKVLPRFQIPRRFFAWPEPLRRTEGKITQTGRAKLIRLAESLWAHNDSPPTSRATPPES